MPHSPSAPPPTTGPGTATGAASSPSAPLDDATLARLNQDQPPTARVSFVDAFDDGDPRRRTRVARFRLGNGLQVLIWEDHSAPVFAYQTWFGVGSRDEHPGRTGMAHLFEHLMFKATRNHPEGELDRIMEDHGAETNAATWVDWTYYREALPAGNLDLVASLEADRMEHLLLDDAQLESEREVVKNERLLRVDNDPDGALYERLYALAYTEHPYRWPTIGWMEDIEAITLEDCLAFYAEHYAPNNATIVLVGDVDTAEALAVIQRHYGHLEASERASRTPPAEPPQTAERRAEMTLPVATEKAVYAWHGPAATDPSHPAATLLAELLGGSESSRLHRRLVLELELCTEVSAWAAEWTYPGLFEVSMTLRPGVTLAQVEPALDAELARLRDELVGPRELTKVINLVEASLLRAAADTGARARGLGDAHTTTGDYQRYFRRLDLLRATHPEAIRAAAREILSVTNRSVVHAVPAEEASP